MSKHGFKKIDELEQFELFSLNKDVLYGYCYGYFNSEMIRNNASLTLEAMKKGFGFKVIIDTEKVLGTWLPSITWFENELIPGLLRNGLQGLAFIQSLDHAAQVSLNRFMEIPIEYNIQVFDDFPSAITWINGSEVISPTLEYQYLVNTGNGVRQIDSRDIYFISKHERKTVIQTKEEQFNSSSSLAEILNTLPQSMFLRVHKSYIVNVQKIKDLRYHAGGYYRAYFNDFGNAYVVVSKLKSQELKNALRRTKGF
ncbi:MAG: LytTR family transcriptional regulator [Flavobacteriales bacterium]|nr:LytTR family transcriptional regulator [Flavobacteriales bacterium]